MKRSTEAGGIESEGFNEVKAPLPVFFNSWVSHTIIRIGSIGDYPETHQTISMLLRAWCDPS
jgi:hypothetical protein